LQTLYLLFQKKKLFGQKQKQFQIFGVSTFLKVGGKLFHAVIEFIYWYRLNIWIAHFKVYPFVGLNHVMLMIVAL